jgi:preprotein translocase subunit SecE
VAKQTTSNLPSKPVAKRSTSPAAKKAAPGSGSGGNSGSASVRRAQSLSIITFFQEARSELSKVTWPNREQTLNLTGAVIVMTVGIAAFLGLVDGALDFIIKPLIGAK